ncbi:uncharacterized protein si:dkey-65b12.12 isoform X3 [Onychostoma macrolepis]|uniref:uncharacterized protein si:dkey-65b12.12 isoform X3 n=1 Tax=Onychostoma macrolepis TaxID=369639 RepID=UPI00272C30CF|nr:uncharacterized protein si:dkey-65b12.12 isoform X3 [Onychostoma macrolepis]
MKLFGLRFSAVWILCCCCCLVYGRGHGVCNERKLVTRINLTTELQSEILLPCLFEQALTGSNLTMSSVAVWTQINEPTDYIVEIKVNGHESFWNNRRNRIKAFRDAAASGNFSILIRDVQLSDLGLYRCKLYTDINCSLGYKEIEIRQKNDEITHASVVPKSRNCHDSEGQKNDEIIYASVVLKSHNCHDSEVILYNNPVNSSASDLVSQETVLYATVKQRERR